MYRKPGSEPYSPVIVLGLFFLSLASCGGKAPEKRIESIFQSVCSVTIHGRPRDADFEAVWKRLREIDGMMNMWDDESSLSALSAAAGSGPVRTTPEIIEALARGLELAELTGGRYDPSVGPLVKLWGVGTPRSRVPSETGIASALTLVDWSKVKLDTVSSTVELASPGMVLDFGSMAKGYGAREAGKMLAKRGVRSALVDVGGCVVAVGSHPSGKPWKIGVQDPSGSRGSDIVGYFEGRDIAVATSGIYERSFEEGGRAYHHIMDTNTGQPVENELVSVSVLVERALNSDGPPLALLALGTDAGLALADRLGLAAIFLRKDNRIVMSSAAKNVFVLTSNTYLLSIP